MGEAPFKKHHYKSVIQHMKNKDKIKKRIAIVGIQGVPSKYGGFETLVEHLIEDDSVEYTVFCSGTDQKQPLKVYKNASLKYIPLKANGIQSIPYDILAMIRSLSGYDSMLVLGVSGASFLPLFRLFSKARVIVNIDGLEHSRQKWGKFTRRYLKWSEKIAVRNSDVVVADNKAIMDYILKEYGKRSSLITYGGDHAMADVPEYRIQEILQKYNLSAGSYAISVCRIEPENNCHIILEACKLSGKNIAFVGNWQRSEYARNLKKQYSNVPNITLINSIYDIEELFVLRSNANCYIHGHSAGGTNPSLVEAMFFNIPIIAYDVVYNRETTFGKAAYFSDVNSLQNLFSENLYSDFSELAQRYYTWDIVRKAYLEVL